MNVTPVSSAALFQETLAVWTPDGFASHQRAVDRVYDALRIALGQVRDSIESDLPVNEYQIQQVIMQNFAKWGLESEDEAIVAVNANSGDPHYEPSKDLWSPIRRDDWLLIDLWAREPGEENIFADVTWVACVGSEPRAEHQRAFAAVTEARDAVVDALDVAWRSGDFGYEGWQLDDVARDVLVRHGYSESVKHRTGHSIGPGRFLHALGVNLDNFETHDTRPVRPGVGFSVEPGVYLPGFGMRSEINVYVDPVSGPLVTTPAQRSIDLLFA
jgi:Xaa-Pro aminopeptidase